MKEQETEALMAEMGNIVQGIEGFRKMCRI